MISKQYGSRPCVILKKGKAKPFWHRHPWIFSGAIKQIKGKPENGDIVDVLDDNRRFIGKGFINQQSQIVVRMLCWDPHERINADFFRNKIRQALAWREGLLAMSSKASAYRLIHSEGDGLPGLTVDRYNDVLVIQLLSAGMEVRRDLLLSILRQETKAKAIVERYPAGYRPREGLEEIDYRCHGAAIDEKTIISEYGLRFGVSLQKGQKTGYYLDQRENRMAISRYAYNKRILDAFCYSGGFGIYLLTKGKAAEVLFMDSSRLALNLAQENLELNSGKSGQFVKADIFEQLPAMASAGELFDMIILDPPKVAPDRSSLSSGISSLTTLNNAAVRMLPEQGILVTCDCSGLIDWGEFTKIVNRAAIDAGRSVRIVGMAGAGPDHPVNPACLENSYLKVITAVVL